MPKITSRFIRRVTAVFAEGERIEYQAGRATTLIVERLVLELGGTDMLFVYGWRKQNYHYGIYANGASHYRQYYLRNTPPELATWVQKMQSARIGEE